MLIAANSKVTRLPTLVDEKTSSLVSSAPCKLAYSRPYSTICIGVNLGGILYCLVN